MKIIKSFFWLALILPMGLLAQTKATISIQNSSTLERKEAVVALKWETVLSHYPQIDTTNFVVINAVTKKQVPFQLEHRGLSSVQNLLVQVSVKAKSTLSLLIQKGKPEIFVAKTYARFVPERKDDFAWENDKIAFRTYGKAIEKTKEDAYGLDVWVKRTDKLIINERYKLGNYHIDNGNGMDYYHVGFSLGAGNMAPYVNDTIRYSANYHQWKVLDNGPLRSSFQLTYDTWDAGGIKVRATKNISLDAGSQLNRIENVYSFEDNKPLPVVVGIIKRPESGIISLNEQQGIIGYWEPTHGEDGTTGVGSILTTPVSNMLVGNAQILAKTAVKNNEPIVYFTGAAWNKAGKITNAKQWFKYLDNFYQQIKEPLVITVK
ncbi:DUF4861 domain-containing protein [Flavobacterium rhamnosiphilum]|uniref:DUF4861 domain-containing protein n=1 Tax=Flavobacterium rhamnosiphilum TaxID=2541724 RepID=A0A4R5F8C8_9FLAO|nr:DUF4861 family protein [Flavobacterium rhamnosiphilum]TDE44331.1 DUF4861 domain-containing protein [Flavobacterium rhamnosiphilum]